MGRLAMALAAAMLAGAAEARAAVLDQSHVDPNPNSYGGLSKPDGSFRRAQTFTAGMSGILDSVAVEADETNEMRILATQSGVPTSTILATSTDQTWSGSFRRFDITAANLAITAGDVLAIELLRTGPDNVVDDYWRGKFDYGGDPYKGGGDYVINVDYGMPQWTYIPYKDWNFRTYVVPEPSTFVLLAAGGLCLLVWRRRVRRRSVT